MKEITEEYMRELIRKNAGLREEDLPEVLEGSSWANLGVDSLGLIGIVETINRDEGLNVSEQVIVSFVDYQTTVNYLNNLLKEKVGD